MDWEAEFGREHDRLVEGWRSGLMGPAAVVHGLTALKREARERGIAFRVARDVVDALREAVMAEMRSIEDLDDVTAGDPILHDRLYVSLPQAEADLVLSFGWRPTKQRPLLMLHQSAARALEASDDPFPRVLSIDNLRLDAMARVDQFGEPIPGEVSREDVASVEPCPIALVGETGARNFAPVEDPFETEEVPPLHIGPHVEAGWDGEVWEGWEGQRTLDDQDEEGER